MTTGHEASSSLPPALVQGRLEGIGVPDLLWALCGRGAHGILTLRQNGVSRKLHLAEGEIRFASSSDPDERLGELLLRKGLITFEQLETAVARLVPGKRLGTVLVEQVAISPQDLVEAVLEQVRQIVRRALLLEEGEYQFEPDEGAADDEMITLKVGTRQLLLEGIREVRSFSRIRNGVGSLAAHYRLSDDAERLAETLDLTASERAVLEHLRSGPVSVGELCRAVELSNFETYRILWAFKVLRLVEEAEGTSVPIAGATLTGTLDRQGVLPVLVRLCREGETGVLYVAKGGLERTFHLREGRCIFATSNRRDDSLLSHLLRRGVISIRDREEVSRRLLSNKRVGTLLTEMGVLDEDDLAEMVREQLLEIIFDTFQWDRGDYAFAAGELPTLEEITLDLSLEDLVLQGVRRIGAWSRVLEGCGGADAVVALEDRYLEILDRMDAGPDEWDLLSLLREPMSVRDVCHRSPLDDFQVAQTLWAFGLLGITRRADEDARVAGETRDAAGAGAVAEDGAPSPEPPPAEAPAAAEAPWSPAGGEPVSEDEFPKEDPWHPPADAEPDAEPAWADGSGETPESEAVEPDGDPWDGPPSEPEEPALEVARPEELAARDEQVEEPEDARRQEDEEDDGGVPPTPLDSPLDATQYIPPEEVAGILGEDAPEDAPAFELDRPDSASADPPGEAEPPDVVQTTMISRDEVHEMLRRGAEAVQPPADPGEGPWADAPPAEQTTGEPDASVPGGDGPAPETAGGAGPEQERLDAAVQDLEALIARFNEMQRTLYQVIKTEIGAGAANFIRSCGSRLDPSLAEVFGSLRLEPDGAWDPKGLRDALEPRGLEVACESFQKLLDEAVDRLAIHIGEARAEALRQELASVPPPPAG